MGRLKDLPILTRAETEIMQVLWSRGSATVHALVEALPRPVAYTTALTLVRILERKGYVRHEPDAGGGRAHVFFPAVPQSKVQRSHVRDLVQRLFGGRPESLILGLVEDEDVGAAKLEELRALIDERLKARKRTHD